MTRTRQSEEGCRQITREELMQAASDYMASGAFLETLARRVSYPTESLVAERAPQIMAYLTEEMVPSLQALGFECRIVDNPVAGKWPFLLARRIEPEAPFTLLTYGHGDVVLGDEANWLEWVDPWKVTPDGDRWYGRGTADNKGQHTINLAALMLVLKAKQGRLGYNLKLILEMGRKPDPPGWMRCTHAIATGWQRICLSHLTARAWWPSARRCFWARAGCLTLSFR